MFSSPHKFFYCTKLCKMKVMRCTWIPIMHLMHYIALIVHIYNTRTITGDGKMLIFNSNKLRIHIVSIVQFVVMGPRLGNSISPCFFAFFRGGIWQAIPKPFLVFRENFLLFVSLGYGKDMQPSVMTVIGTRVMIIIPNLYHDSVLLVVSLYTSTQHLIQGQPTRGIYGYRILSKIRHL